MHCAAVPKGIRAVRPWSTEAPEDRCGHALGVQDVEEGVEHAEHACHPIKPPLLFFPCCFSCIFHPPFSVTDFLWPY